MKGDMMEEEKAGTNLSDYAATWLCVFLAEAIEAGLRGHAAAIPESVCHELWECDVVKRSPFDIDKNVYDGEVTLSDSFITAIHRQIKLYDLVRCVVSGGDE